MGRANVADLVDRAARRDPGGVALTGPAGQWTWAQLAAQVDAVAAGLADLGVAGGDRVGLLLGNAPEFVLGYFGALRAGGVAVPLNTGYTGSELTYQLADSATRFVLTGAEHAGVLESSRPQLPALERVVLAGGPEWSALLAAPAAGSGGGATAVPRRGGEDLAVLLYTSGTSGRPKGAMLSHRALLANLEQVPPREPPVMSSADVVLVVIPMFHVYGLNAGLGMVARYGATAVLLDRFDAEQALRAVQDYGVTVIVGAPPMYSAWSRMPGFGAVLRAVRLAISGAAPLPVGALGQLREQLAGRVHEGYGLTETAPVLTTTLASPVPLPGSIGRPVPGVELRLLDENGDRVEDGDPGEITVRGANLFSGYWPDGVDGPDEQGWFRTGDVAYADAGGDLFLVDRRSDLILVSGFNVYPREVEEVLLTHPAVAEAAVLGRPHPHSGETVHALVVARGTEPTAAELVEHCARSLARFKCPTAVEFVPELPHSATGKVSKGRLRGASGG